MSRRHKIMHRRRQKEILTQVPIAKGLAHACLESDSPSSRQQNYVFLRQAPSLWASFEGQLMRRREFITLIGGAVAWPLAARAQHKLPTVGVLGVATSSAWESNIAAFTQRLD